MDFTKLTPKSQEAVAAAQELARRMGNPELYPEHLLLALLDQELPQQLVPDAAALRTQAEATLRGKPSVQGTTQQPNVSTAFSRVLDRAADEAKRLEDDYISTEHLLLALDAVPRDQLLAALKEVRGGQRVTSQDPEGTYQALEKFGRDLTAAAEEGKLDPVIGRDEEIRRVIQVLSRRTKNNPVLIGEPGVGKTAIPEGLAQRIVRGDVPEVLRNKRVVQLDLAALVAGTKYRGEFEERMKKVMDEIRKAQNEVVLFVDELHTLVGAGAAEGAIDASNILKPALARGELQCIGATTLDEYRKYVERDAALERRFQPILVSEPSVEQTIEILKGLRERYESHHGVTISDEALVAAATLAEKYIADRFLPDKAIDLMDEASSKIRLQASFLPQEVRQAVEKAERVRREKEEAIKNQDFEKAAQLRDKERVLRQKLEELESSWKREKGRDISTVTGEDIADVVSSWTGIPVTRLVEEETQRLLKMEESIHERIVGQEEAVSAVAKAVRRARTGLKDPRRPVGSFIFLGPSGVGKTELARALAEFLFGDENALIRIDMSEYSERHTISRLVGSPPGYVGYEEGGQLTEAVRRRPFSIVLFDEIEKAHPEIFNVLLQILDDGRLTDAQGRAVDFKNAVIIMTSNVGAPLLEKEVAIGFKPTRDELTAMDSAYARMKEHITEELRRTFRPEFLNRIDEVIIFRPLTGDQIKAIADILIARVQRELRGQNMQLELTEAAKDLLAKEGFDPTFGARPLRRTIQRLIEDQLSDELLRGSFTPGDTVVVDARDERIVFERKRQPEPALKGD